MESNSDQDNLPVLPNNTWTQEEIALLAEIEEKGVRPYSQTVVTQLFSLFLEGYTCADVAKHAAARGILEGEVLWLRKRHKWDEERDKFIMDLNSQIRSKLLKAKLEGVEHLTNMLAVAHKKYKHQMLSYLQTGNENDLPELQILNLKMYRDTIEALTKLTGEDRIQKHQIDAVVQNEMTLASGSEAALRQLIQDAGAQSNILELLVQSKKENQ